MNGLRIKSNRNLLKLLQERIDKANPRRKLVKDETTKLAKLEGIAEKLKGRENVQNRQLSYRLGLLKTSSLPLHRVLAVVNFTTVEMLSC